MEQVRHKLCLLQIDYDDENVKFTRGNTKNKVEKATTYRKTTVEFQYMVLLKISEKIQNSFVLFILKYLYMNT